MDLIQDELISMSREQLCHFSFQHSEQQYTAVFYVTEEETPGTYDREVDLQELWREGVRVDPTTLPDSLLAQLYSAALQVELQ